jgi:ribosomal protein S18 acetylase RimI-like enzyme
MYAAGGRITGVTDLTVRAMTEPEYDAWRTSVATAFASEQVAAGRWSGDGAVERALREHDEVLWDGVATPGMVVLTGVRSDGTAVGTLWIGLHHPRGVPGCAFLYDIEVTEEHRGAGYGRDLLAAGEAAARSHGAHSMELNVFGGNARAMRLYETTGYRVVSQQMMKHLDS